MEIRRVWRAREHSAKKEKKEKWRVREKMGIGTFAKRVSVC
jgi:hypothetical protein